MKFHPSATVLPSVLRLVPDANSDETIAPADVAHALGISVDAADQHFCRATRKGLVVRVRFGAYRLAPRAQAAQPSNSDT